MGGFGRSLRAGLSVAIVAARRFPLRSLTPSRASSLRAVACQEGGTVRASMAEGVPGGTAEGGGAKNNAGVGERRRCPPPDTRPLSRSRPDSPSWRRVCMEVDAGSGSGAERGGRRAGCAAPRAGQCLDGSSGSGVSARMARAASAVHSSLVKPPLGPPRIDLRRTW